MVGAGERNLDGLEKELSDECSKRTGRSSDGVMIPHDVLAYGRRDLVKATASLGGNLVATDLLAGSFIELLRNRMMIARLGATSLNGLVGDVAIPRRSGGATAYWVTEVQSTTESDATFDQVTLTPKCVTALQEYSRKLLIQGTPDVEGLVRTDLATCLALAIDLAALHGTGTEQPTGIIGVSGIGDVAGGTHGAAPTWAHVVGLETEVAIDNADIGTLAYLTNARVRGKLKTTAKSTAVTDFIWGEGPIGDGFGMINGYRAGVSNQVSGALTKGTSTTVASAIFFGNWHDLLIGNWAGLDILVDPYTAAATRIYKIYVNQYVDVAVRHPQSFACMKDALPA
jgi:HK97 family phage major capsid protein